MGNEQCDPSAQSWSKMIPWQGRISPLLHGIGSPTPQIGRCLKLVGNPSQLYWGFLLLPILLCPYWMGPMMGDSLALHVEQRELLKPVPACGWVSEQDAVSAWGCRGRRWVPTICLFSSVPYREGAKLFRLAPGSLQRSHWFPGCWKGGSSLHEVRLQQTTGCSTWASAWQSLWAHADLWIHVHFHWESLWDQTQGISAAFLTSVVCHAACNLFPLQFCPDLPFPS